MLRKSKKLQRNKAVLKKIINNRVPLYHKNFPLILLWSQKSGCTSLVKWFLYQIGHLEKAMKYDPGIHKYENRIFKQRHNYKKDIAKELILSRKKVYKLVRNPYKRAVSSFLILASNPNNPYWNKEWEQIREYYYKNKNTQKGISFKQFLYLILHQKHHSINPHFSRQYIEGEELFVDKYIYLEDFAVQITELEKTHNLKNSPLNIVTNSQHHLSKLSTLNGNFADYEITETIFLNETPPRFPTYDSFYDNETTNLVREIFKKDFDMFGYDY